MNFKELALSESTLKKLDSLNFTTPTLVQKLAIPHVLEGRDVMAQAQTGSGKTLAFSLPVLEKLDNARNTVQALILTPTRELSHQVADALEQFTEDKGFGVARVVGGEPIADQMIALQTNCQIVVGTPGRVIDLMGQGILSLSWLEVLVFDEADRMLDMGFIDQIKDILEKTPPERQTLLFSATFEKPLRKIAKKYMTDSVTVEASSGLKTADKIDQKYVKIRKYDKEKLLFRLLDVTSGQSSIVFCNTKRRAAGIGRELWGRGYSAVSLHGDMTQEMRNKIIEDFRKGDIQVLVATDIAQRGLDIDHVRAVINYEVPLTSESYVHRIGRTGRAGRSGTVLTLVDRHEWHEFTKILKDTTGQVDELPIPDDLSTWRDAATGGRNGRGRHHSRQGGGRQGGGRQGGGRHNGRHKGRNNRSRSSSKDRRGGRARR